MKHFIVRLLLLTVFIGCTNRSNEMIENGKIVIAHRGASGYLPEHTLASKAMAFAMNVDYIEQDIVLSKDDIPIVIHDIFLEFTTDVAQKFPNRNRKDGHYYVIDFTFDELKTLSVFERFNTNNGAPLFPGRFPKENSRFGLYSLSEEIELIQGLEKSTGKIMGIYPEIKNPDFHRKEGKDISSIVLRILENYGYQNKKDKCILQCFDSKELRRIREEQGSQLFLVQLMESPEEIAQIEAYARYADGIGPSLELLENPSLMTNAKKHNLVTHAYTLRKDQLDNEQSFEAFIEKVLYQYGVDGVFTDHPDIVVNYINSK